ncbi:MAG: hypothetical protein ACI3XG_05740 [Faecousia sp.]
MGTMLLFIVLFFPGILFAYAAEFLMRRRLDRHSFFFLVVFNILAINFVAMLLRNVVTVFLTGEDYKMAIESMDHFVKQIIFSGIVGAPLCLLEAIIGRYVTLRLDDTKKEAEAE